MRKNLKADEKKELDRIVCEENALEHTRYGSVLDADRFAFPDRKTRLRLTGTDPAGVPAFAAVYELGETYHGRPVREVSIFTDIRFRRKGLGTALLEKIRTPDAVRRKAYCIARILGSKGKMVFNADDRSMQFDSSDVLVRYWWGRDPERTAFAGSLPVPRRDLDLRTLAHFAACVHERALQPYVTLAAASEMCRWQERLWSVA